MGCRDETESLHLCPPLCTLSWTALADLQRDLTSPARNGNWGFAYSADGIDDAKPLQRFLPEQQPKPTSGVKPDVLWACPNTTPKLYPHYTRYLLHPCAGNTPKCCGQNKTSAHAIYTSWFELEDVVMLVTYEVMPACGDGLTVTGERVRRGGRGLGEAPSATGLESNSLCALTASPPAPVACAVTHSPQGSAAAPRELHRQRFEGGASAPTRLQLALHIPSVAAGDRMALTADPHASADCDGVYVTRWEIWRSADAADLYIN